MHRFFQTSNSSVPPCPVFSPVVDVLDVIIAAVILIVLLLEIDGFTENVLMVLAVVILIMFYSSCTFNLSCIS